MIVGTLARCFGADLLWSGGLTLIYTLLQFVSPLMVDLIIG
jgi:hypothetical protein